MLPIHRRVRLGAVIVLGVLMALPGCSGGSAPPAPSSAVAAPSSTVPMGPRYGDQRAGFALTPPAGFRQVEPLDPPVAAAFNLPGEGPGTLRASLTVVVTPTDADLAGDTAGARQTLPTVFPDYQSTVDEPITLPGGQPGWLLGGAYTLRGAKVRTVQLMVVGHQTSYVVTGLTSARIFNKFDPVFRATFNSFSLL